MNEQTVDSYYGYDYQPPSVVAHASRSKWLKWVGVLGMVACAASVTYIVSWRVHFSLLLQSGGEPSLALKGFGVCLSVFIWVVRGCNLGCFVALVAAGEDFRRSVLCWMGLAGIALSMVCAAVMGLVPSAALGNTGNVILVHGLLCAGVFQAGPVFEMRRLVPRRARFIGTLGGLTLLAIHVFNYFFRVVLFIQAGWAEACRDLLRRHNYVSGFWFPLMVDGVLLVFYLLVFLSRERTFEPDTAKWYEGRARRREWWETTLCYELVGVGGALLLFFCTGDVPRGFTGSFVKDFLVAELWALPFLVATIPVTVRRLHDRNMSGWWLVWFTLLSTIPFVGWIVPIVELVIIWFLDGTPGPNLYGPDPKGRTFGQFPGYAPAQPIVDPAEQESKLRQLKSWKDEGLISESEYAEKRAQILSEM